MAEIRKPDFICVGLPKAGTSTLHNVLDCHCDIAMPPVKEIKYLIQDELNYNGARFWKLFSSGWPAQQDRAFFARFCKRAAKLQANSYEAQSFARYYFNPRTDDAWYRGLFHPDAVSGDVTVNYFWLKEPEIRKLAADYPWMKVIIMLRSPVQLNWSYFRMVALRKKESGVFEPERFLREIEEKKQRIGRYAEMVRRWQSAFGEDRVMIGYFDGLRDDPVQFFDGVCEFLGVDGAEHWDDGMRQAMGRIVNTSPKLQMSEDLAGPILELSELNLEGFEAIKPRYADLWRGHIEDARRSVMRAA
ncbi:sulfotransferase (plasmid) [Salipiger sp. H15]|uniref:Sulfotransferase n=1 Tax=Alloyangia sp. H15 TaxID=3029062 RepID=A0AAU8APZ7_9RHOB